MALEDKTLTCSDCGKSFTFTVGEQEFYKTKGLQHDPARCPDCRAARRKGRSGSGGYGQRQMFTATCASCGASCEVPFEPKQDRPVYCSACYSSQKKDAR